MTRQTKRARPTARERLLDHTDAAVCGRGRATCDVESDRARTRRLLRAHERELAERVAFETIMRQVARGFMIMTEGNARLMANEAADAILGPQRSRGKR